MKYRIVESVEKKENINHPVDDNFTLSEELLNIKTEKINESVDNKPINEDWSHDYDTRCEYRNNGVTIDVDGSAVIIAYYYADYDEDTGEEYEPKSWVSECSEKLMFNSESDAKEAAKRLADAYNDGYDNGDFVLGEIKKEYNLSESLEEDYEYSEYDKKLLVNRAKSIAKAISDLYNSNQVEAQGELPSVNEIAKALLDSPKKIDMYAKFLSKMKATKKAESLIEKLVKELMNFKKKLSMVKKPQHATESMNESVEELSEEEKKEIIDTLENMIESGETSCECWDEPTKFLVKSELRKKGLKFNVSGNDRGNKFSYHFEWWNPKTESMDESRSVYTMSSDQMDEWNDICKAFAKKVGAKLVFVNETSCGLEFPDGSMKHVYIDDMMDYLGGMNESCDKEKKSYTKEEIMNMSTDKQRDVYENCVDHDKYPSFASWKKVFSTATPKTKTTKESFKRVPNRSINESEVSNKRNNNG